MRELEQQNLIQDPETADTRESLTYEEMARERREVLREFSSNYISNKGDEILAVGAHPYDELKIPELKQRSSEVLANKHRYAESAILKTVSR